MENFLGHDHVGKYEFSDILGLYFIGSGGLNSRIELRSSLNPSVHNTLYLSRFNSVYALDLNIETGNLAVGTKGGLIIIIENMANHLDFSLKNIIKLHQGAPVLSICWVTANVLAVSDAAGRCYLWSYQTNSPTPYILPVLDTPICALLRLKEGSIVGLSTKGTLQIWQMNPCRLEQSVRVPEPGSKAALVLLKYWAENNTIVYPDKEGNIAQVIFPALEVNFHRLNNGEFYAFDCFDEYLGTNHSNTIIYL